MDEQVKKDLTELFDILDSTEETDEGGTFHPTHFHTARALHVERLNIILPRLREYIRSEERADKECLDAFDVRVGAT